MTTAPPSTRADPHFTREWKKWGQSNTSCSVTSRTDLRPIRSISTAWLIFPKRRATIFCGSKFATSAANVTGKKLVSAEAATWLDEHFALPGEVKKAADLFPGRREPPYFYHGTAYSPLPRPGLVVLCPFIFNLWIRNGRIFMRSMAITRTQSFCSKADRQRPPGVLPAGRPVCRARKNLNFSISMDGANFEKRRLIHSPGGSCSKALALIFSPTGSWRICLFKRNDPHRRLRLPRNTPAC